MPPKRTLPNNSKDRMEEKKVYRDSDGSPQPMVWIEVNRRGCWVANSYSQECKEYVDGIVKEQKYDETHNGTWLVELMEQPQYGFVLQGTHSGNRPSREVIATLQTLTFDHQETEAERRKQINIQAKSP